MAEAEGVGGGRGVGRRGEGRKVFGRKNENFETTYHAFTLISILIYF
jgi:hypothetical protein